jgi:hypothetical protein
MLMLLLLLLQAGGADVAAAGGDGRVGEAVEGGGGEGGAAAAGEASAELAEGGAHRGEGRLHFAVVVASALHTVERHLLGHFSLRFFGANVKYKSSQF